jgi:3-deoxy-D-manno-octulosonic acid kinase
MADSRMTQIESGAEPNDRPDAGAMLPVERIEPLENGAILYDGSRLNHAQAAWFDPASWPDVPSTAGRAGGRGAALFIRLGDHDCVLRHYYRGGLAARFARDGFVWRGQDHTRSFAEWRLLARILAAGLPGPRPVAARYLHSGLLYRADLITVRIPDVMPFSSRLTQGYVDAGTWRRIGECIGRFHAARFCHADLNAHNIQIDLHGEVFLLDFDRGRQMPGDGPWRQQNLERLRRSLDKISGAGAFRFEPDRWLALLEGYGARVNDGSSR